MNAGISAILSSTDIAKHLAHIPLKRNVFNNNEEAAAYVQQRADEGSRYHKGIITILMRRKFEK